LGITNISVMKVFNVLKVAFLCAIAIAIASTYYACTDAHATQKNITFTENPDIIKRLNWALTETLVQDGFAPPVASRAFVYSNIAAYEALLPADSTRVSLGGQLNELDTLPKPDPNVKIDATISMVVAYRDAAKSIVYRDHIMDAAADTLIAELSATLDKAVVDSSIAWGTKVGAFIIAWSKKDHFKETRNMPRYEAKYDDPSAWIPTPPKFIAALEPYWNKVRPFSMTSASEFSPGLKTPFSAEKGSDFYNYALEVYETVNNTQPEHLPIALFWDCNPLVSENSGHYMALRRQFSPGAHWINITRKACDLSKADLCKSMEAYVLVSIAIADGFISAWDEKYTSNLIRPETYINRYIDANWKPLIETPMFPEHTSAHSVISMSAATVLTMEFGEPFAYVDSTNVPYDRPARSFNSFKEAANEAGMSRLYAGIHYRPAFEMGLKQGGNVAQNLLSKVRIRKEESVQ
jgi:hypothetical protein